MSVKFQIYEKPTGLGTGSYKDWLLRGAEVEIDRSLFEGDIMNITSTRKSQDPQIDKVRPVRLYWNNTKIFDGCIRAPKYDNRSDKTRDLVASAYGWEKELAAIRIDIDPESPEGAIYENKSIDYIFNDLVRIANNLGMTKKATYVYDTSKLPYYDSDVFGTLVTKVYSDSVWSAMMDLTRELDIAETLHIGEWAVKVDALQSEFYIYIIPLMANTDQAPVKEYADFMLTPPKRIRKDYSRLLNHVVVRGKGTLKNTQLSPTLILAETNIPTNTESFYAENQPSARHYLRTIIKNPTAAGKGGFVRINGSDGLLNELTERFYLWVPAYTEQRRFSNERYATLSGGAVHAFEIDSFSGCTITVEEVMYGISGRSINDYGMRGESIRNTSLDTQSKVDLYASLQARMYHAPLVFIDAVIKPSYADTIDLVGKTVKLYDNFQSSQEESVCVKQGYYFAGTRAHETISAMRYNYDWEYTE